MDRKAGVEVKIGADVLQNFGGENFSSNGFAALSQVITEKRGPERQCEPIDLEDSA